MITNTKNKQSIWSVIIRGILGRCPQCGSGKLFRSYLKQVNHCGVCQEELGHIRADDGPAWLTIVVVGHFIAVFCLDVLPHVAWPDWISMMIIMTSSLLLTLVLLPRSKGIFIGLIWRSGCVGAEK